MFKRSIALLVAVLTIFSLCSCSLFGKEEEVTEPSTEFTTEWTTEWTTEETTVEESSTESVSVHDCATQGHLWAGATCRAPKTCTVCGLTEGSKVDHSYRAATCTSAQRCRYCGLTKGSALGHTYNDAGKCTRCGASKTIAEAKTASTNSQTPPAASPEPVSSAATSPARPTSTTMRPPPAISPRPAATAVRPPVLHSGIRCPAAFAPARAAR